MGRIKLKEEPVDKIGSYFLSDKKDIDFISSGSTLLNLVLGGGWAMGRMSNLVGDKSSGKTLLAIEACANFVKKYPKGKIYYHETEAAFDKNYAGALGMPVDKVIFIEDIMTVEGMFKFIDDKILDKSKIPKLYILDSLDALDATEDSRKELDEAGYSGARKAGKLSSLFRKRIKDIEGSNICLLIISQIRVNIGVTFGKKTTRSGGKALDFYASQIVWLKTLSKISKTISGITRPYSLLVRANCEKNKVGLAFRECEFPILFGYGINSVLSNLQFLEKTKFLDKLSFKFRRIQSFAEKIIEENDIDKITEIDKITKEVWNNIESGFLPKRRKY